MSASAHHLKGFIPVLEEKEGAPLGDVAGPKFAHGIQIPLIEGIIGSLHRNGKQMQKKCLGDHQSCSCLIRLQCSSNSILQLWGRIRLCTIAACPYPKTRSLLRLHYYINMVNIIRLIVIVVIVMYAVNICEVLYLLLNMTHIGSLSTQPSLRVVLSRAQHARSLLAGCYEGGQPPLGQQDIHIHPSISYDIQQPHRDRLGALCNPSNKCHQARQSVKSRQP